jgi:uncharacterized protein DUF4129
MSARSRRGRRRISPLVYALVLVAPIVLGIAAALLAGPVAPPGTKTVVSSHPIDVSLSLIADVVLGGLGVVIVVRVIRLIRGDVPAIPASQFLSVALMVFLVAIVLIFALRFAGGASPTSKVTPPTHNGTGGVPVGNGSNRSGNLSNALPILGFQIPAWTVYVALAAVAVGVGVALIPLMIARSETDPKPSAPNATPGLSALRDALADLERRGEDDPRRQIIAMYGRLLDRVGHGLVDLAILTPREIESACRRLLGIGPESAHVLTALFEEARYSQHPVGFDLVERARNALKQALADLDHRDAGWAS